MKENNRPLLLLVSFVALLIPSSRTFAQDRHEIDALFRDYDGPGVPGASVMVIKEGKVVFKNAYGWARIEDKIPSTPQTNYNIASITKQFTAMAAMILADRKKLNYDDSITKFFPDFPSYGKSITVRNLLNHTSGLLDYKDIIPPGVKTFLSDKDIFELLKRQDHGYFPAGTKYRYSNAGYLVLSLIVEKASGDSFTEFLKKNIFEPLQMSNTRFYDPNDFSDRNRSMGYALQSEGFQRATPGLTAHTLGDGCLYSSVEDLYKWDKALYTTKLVDAETLKLAFTPAIETDTLDRGYGFGWFVSKRNGYADIWHSGGSFGSASYIHRLPEKRLTVIVLSNRQQPGDLREITDQIVDMYMSDKGASFVEQELLRVHRAYSDAVNKGDRKLIASLTADDFIRVTAVGVDNKSEVPIEVSYDVGSITEDFVKVRLYGAVGVITGRVNVSFKDDAFQARYTEVWHKERAGWRIVSSQLTSAQGR